MPDIGAKSHPHPRIDYSFFSSSSSPPSHPSTCPSSSAFVGAAQSIDMWTHTVPPCPMLGLTLPSQPSCLGPTDCSIAKWHLPPPNSAAGNTLYASEARGASNGGAAHLLEGVSRRPGWWMAGAASRPLHGKLTAQLRVPAPVAACRLHAHKASLARPDRRLRTFRLDRTAARPLGNYRTRTATPCPRHATFRQSARRRTRDDICLQAGRRPALAALSDTLCTHRRNCNVVDDSLCSDSRLTLLSLVSALSSSLLFSSIASSFSLFYPLRLLLVQLTFAVLCPVVTATSHRTGRTIARPSAGV
ncbi:unnamed protein product [Protopolystoma xenopodis]|uniref:Uncharacterized protein n=1 Tax=Protopolystoma xenopodis TaxID=117903 RepID=A0A448XQE6_9PLAT|nr:unnamed protein product [Protopolystoma xenopodis]